ncbi:hypothetical protein GCM10022225_08470 [Plantactinospora mayteni]|uniref:Uncharacterized protein n=1 Tax=Plantactinospora mayteni TaxID=566021 RepID=A0ABQ4EI41_9ACTN|nr:hypothetical protein [Plantactinospora mayteni]GIG94406.1 hypothetical protein Pma05_09790 [Plantactinospora mayteni]
MPAGDLAVTAYDLVAMGRTGVDIYPLEHGVGLEDVKRLEVEVLVGDRTVNLFQPPLAVRRGRRWKSGRTRRAVQVEEGSVEVPR